LYKYRFGLKETVIGSLHGVCVRIRWH